MSFNLVKIHATGSTNDDLKARFRESELPHLTVLHAQQQTAGKGQMGSKWDSEQFKSLTFSILMTNQMDRLTNFQLSQFIAVSITSWLREELNIQALIKWPNDILSVNHKLGGILIENMVSEGKRRASIIGIGLNINQSEFSSLPKAISLYQLTGVLYDIDQLLTNYLAYLMNHLKDPDRIIERYSQLLFKKDQITTFTIGNRPVKALVRGVTSDGKLILYHNGVDHTYDLKEVKWMY